MEILLKYRITGTDDLAFIEQEFMNQVTLIEKACNSEEGGTSKKHLTMEDRLRFIIILATDDVVRAAYLSHTDGLDRVGVDYQNSDKRQPSWAELLCERFNDTNPLNCYSHHEQK